MTDQIEETVEGTEPVEPKTAEVVKTEKVFSQEDVNKAVKERVAREKGVATKLQQEFDEYKNSAEEEIKSLKDTVLSLIKDKLESVPEETKELLSKLDLKDQVDWLSKHSAEVKKTLPKLPKGSNDEVIRQPEKKRFY